MPATEERLMSGWVTHFREKSARRITIPWELGVSVPSHLRPHIVRSLQRFQLGERGDGAHLKRVAAGIGDPEYVKAIALFVKEEQEHAALMARALREMGAPLLGSHWSDRFFRLICTLSGLHAELPVLIVAEVIAKRYFRVLHDSTGDTALQAMCKQILHDEEYHIAFHLDALRLAIGSLPALLRTALLPLWRSFFRVVSLVVAYDHRRLFRAAGVSPATFVRDALSLFDTAASQVVPTNTCVSYVGERKRQPSGAGAKRGAGA